MNDIPDLGEIEDGNRAWWEVLHEPGSGLNSVYVPGEGNETDPIAMVIGEAPGAVEQVKFRPFVGPAGVAQRDLMALAGLWANDGHVTLSGGEKWPATANCWLTNVVHFRPPKRVGLGNAPSEDEITCARPWLRQEWEAVGKPRLIIPVGGVALYAITGKRISILAAAGRCHWYTNRDGVRMAIWPMVHPSFGLRNPDAQPFIEKDWLKLNVWREANRYINW